MSSANNDNFISSFPMWIPFISCSCLIAVTRFPSIMLNKNDECGHPSLFPDLKGNAYSFCPLSLMLAIGLSYTAIIMLWCVPFIPILLRIFIINVCWILSNAFLSIDMIMLLTHMYSNHMKECVFVLGLKMVKTVINVSW